MSLCFSANSTLHALNTFLMEHYVNSLPVSNDDQGVLEPVQVRISFFVLQIESLVRYYPFILSVDDTKPYRYSFTFCVSILRIIVYQYTYFKWTWSTKQLLKYCIVNETFKIPHLLVQREPMAVGKYSWWLILILMEYHYQRGFAPYSSCVFTLICDRCMSEHAISSSMPL